MCQDGCGPTVPSMNVIEVTGLVKRYGKRVAVDGVSLSVADGEIFGILGPNGAGKTTTVECVAGLRNRDGGSVRVLGLDPRADRGALRQVLGVQLQESQLPDQLRVGEALELYASFYSDPADTVTLLAQLGLEDQRGTPFRKLSGGQKQRVSIALALVGRPKIAILDELTTGLDPQARRDTWQLIEAIRDSGVTVVLVTHFMEEAERLCDRVALIDRGRVVALDTPAGLIGKAAPEQRVRFRPSAELDLSLLRALPEVRDVARAGAAVVVSGHGDLAGAVTALIARQQIVAHELRIEQSNLDDAFLALTGKQLNETMEVMA
jgi:ABC-2 type transport system ATP-binding protein